jgi:hypothetical protein
MPHGVLADGKEKSLRALIGKRLEDRLGISRPRAIVEGQYHLAFAKEIVSFELLETETGAASGIDFNDASNAERIRIPTCRSRRGSVWYRECCGACE